MVIDAVPTSALARLNQDYLGMRRCRGRGLIVGGIATIRVKVGSGIVEWSQMRGTDTVHPLTQEILDAITGQARVPE